MKSYKFISHTADVRLHTEGDTVPELFEAAVSGMNAILKKGICAEGRDLDISKTLELKSIDAATLLVDFLSEILSLSQQKKAVFCRTEFEYLDDTGLRATVRGVKVDGFDEDVKAVTYHEAEVTRNKRGRWECIVIFDI